MTEITKPSDINKVWSSAGDIISPSDTKIQQGWSVEIPPRQWFNWLDNKQDQAIAHINQHGLSVWDTVTEYQANKSYVQGSNGNLYKALTTNTNINPTTDGGTNWQVIATLPLASTSQAQGWSNTASLLSPSLLNLALKGSNQSLVGNGYQKLPGGLIIQWGSVASVGTGGVTVTYPLAYPNTVLITVPQVSVPSGPVTQFVNAVNSGTPNASFIVAINTGTAAVGWISVGY